MRAASAAPVAGPPVANPQVALLLLVLLDGGQSCRVPGFLRQSCYCFPNTSLLLTSLLLLCHRIVFWTILSSLCVTPSRFKVLWGSGPLEAISLCVHAHGHVSMADRLADIRRVKPVLLASAVIGSALHFSLQFWAVNIYLRGSFWWKSVGIHLFSVWQHWGSLFLSFFDSLLSNWHNKLHASEVQNFVLKYAFTCEILTTTKSMYTFITFRSLLLLFPYSSKATIG